MKIKHLGALVLAVITAMGAMAQDLVPKHNDKGQFGYGPEGSKTFTIKPEWDEARPFNSQGMAIVRKGQMYGMIGRDGKPIGKKMGYSIIAPYDGTEYLLVAEGGSRNDKAYDTPIRKDMVPKGFRGSLSYPITNAKWGLARQDGSFQIQPQYQELSNVSATGAIVVILKGLWGMVDISGRTLHEPQYSVISPVNADGLAWAKDKKGLTSTVINDHGHTIVSDRHKTMEFVQFLNDQKGMFNMVTADSVLKNKELCDHPDYLIPMAKKGRAWLNSKHPYVIGYKTIKKKKNVALNVAIFDKSGNTLLPYEEGMEFCTVPSDGMTVVVRDKKTGLYDLTNRSVTWVEDGWYYPFHNGVSLWMNGKGDDFYFVDKTGHRQSEHFDGITIADKHFIVKKSDRYGVLTKTGEEVLPMDFKEIIDANEGHFAVRNHEGQVGYIDTLGTITIPFEYAEGAPFFNGYACVGNKKPGSIKKAYGIIDKQNKVVVPLAYEKIVGGFDNAGNLTAWVKENGVFNVYDPATKTLTPTRYTDMQMLPYGTCTKADNGTFGLLVGSTEVIPSSLPSADAVAMLWQYMQDNNIASVSPSEARAISVRLNPARNSFKIFEKISPNYWDF